MKKTVYLLLILTAMLGCKKSSDFRRIPNGTMVKMNSNVRLAGSTAPFIVDSLYQQSDSYMNFYYCTDAHKLQWIIPDNDLIIIN